MHRILGVLASFLTFLACVVPGYAQSATSGTIRGSVLDPSGAAIPGASVTAQNPVSHFSETATTDAQGNFQINNVPFNN
jgi:hypothetical protein